MLSFFGRELSSAWSEGDAIPAQFKVLERIYHEFIAAISYSCIKYCLLIKKTSFFKQTC